MKVTYLGASVEKQQNVGSNSHFDFNTVLVTADLQESDDDDITTSATWEYRYGWGTHTAFDPVAGIERLPVNTKVKVTYLGASVEKQQNVGSNSHFDFNTVLVTATLMDGGTDLTLDPGTTWQYRYGWGSHSSLDPSGTELLPVNTKVKVTYSGESKEKQQNVGSSAVFAFTWNGSTINLTAPEGELIDIANGESTLNFGDHLQEIPEITAMDIFPNPVSTGTTIDVQLAKEDNYQIAVYDLNGKLIDVIHRGVLPAGEHRLSWDASTRPSGYYLVRMQGEDVLLTKGINVIR